MGEVVHQDTVPRRNPPATGRFDEANPINRADAEEPDGSTIRYGFGRPGEGA